jgi:HEAT repeat protein
MPMPDPRTLPNTIFYLLGYPGVGKLTVARAICADTGARLFDNHLVNNVVFSLIRKDGKTPLPSGVWHYVRNIRREAIAAIRELGDPEQSYVLTNFLSDGDEEDADYFAEIEHLAEARGATFVPVTLACSEAENIRRLTDPARERGFKLTDPERLIQRRQDAEILKVRHPNALRVDSTTLSPEAVARLIVDHAAKCA